MRIARNDAEFVTKTKMQRDLQKLVKHAACYAHNKGIGLKAIDPTRETENAKFVLALERIITRVAKLHARDQVSEALIEAENISSSK